MDDGPLIQAYDNLVGESLPEVLATLIWHDFASKHTEWATESASGSIDFNEVNPSKLCIGLGKLRFAPLNIYTFVKEVSLRTTFLEGYRYEVEITIMRAANNSVYNKVYEEHLPPSSCSVRLQNLSDSREVLELGLTKVCAYDKGKSVIKSEVDSNCRISKNFTMRKYTLRHTLDLSKANDGGRSICAPPFKLVLSGWRCHASIDTMKIQRIDKKIHALDHEQF